MKFLLWGDGTKYGDPNAHWGSPSYVLEPGDPGYVPPTPTPFEEPQGVPLGSRYRLSRSTDVHNVRCRANPTASAALSRSSTDESLFCVALEAWPQPRA